MQMNELGEFGFIRRLASRFIKNLPEGIEGIGDDCAIFPFCEDQSLIVTTDLLVENVHFTCASIPPKDLGYKCLAVNLSDIAAMGGKPLYAFLSIGIPSNTKVEWLDHFLDGFQELANQSQVYLLGGDTTCSSSLVINVLMMGQVKTSHIKRRSGAKPLDLICCTGHLGNSGAGLQILLNHLPLDELKTSLVYDHFHPTLYLNEGIWLANQPGVHAMIDVSDGIDSDVRRIMEQSHCGAVINLDLLPLSPALIQVAQELDWNVQELAATAGEDYCLLLTVDPTQYETISRAYLERFGHPLYLIGSITGVSDQLTYLKDSESTSLNQHGFDHFMPK